ncbi:DegT/DnrJ/EryC1/StrS family aminotransferase [Methanolobus sp. WCC4]|uniref:DegT/DnrJ/EryC1/StrS family aminotransferase n=1 Tax=Methanolobus sp. WCC4 TaxID=3125784 RepID=UPI0030F8AF4B
MKSSQKTIYHNEPTIGQEEIEAVAAALSNLELTIGSKVEIFERSFSKYIGINSVSTSSGTSALHMALNAIGVSKDDHVIVPSYTCIAVALPVLYQQARPILVDVKDDFNISVDEIRKNITDRTKAIVVPHMFGYPADMNEIKKLCVDTGIYMIEDCSQSIGAEYHGKKVGTVGDISIFSFYATKLMTSIRGGMVCSKDPQLLDSVKELRYHDQCRLSEDHDMRLKYSYMMSDIEASVGIIQLSKLGDFILRRREISKMYKELLEGYKIEHPPEDSYKKHVFSRYVIKTPFNPVKVIDRMRSKDIFCERMHIPPLHKRSLFNSSLSSTGFAQTDRIINSAVSLPIYPTLDDDQVVYIIDSLNEVLGDFT